MEGVLKELGERAAVNPNAIPQHLREALQSMHVDNSTTTLSQAGPSRPYLSSSGK